jgi:hypothetical protein
MNGAKWYCFLLDCVNSRGVDDIEEYLCKQMKDVFGDDFVDIRIIGERISDSYFEIFSDSYFFVCCTNYQKHIKDINRCSCVSLVLPDIQNPEEVNIESIDRFDKTVCNEFGNTGELKQGTLVKVKEGYLENLYGFVIEKKKEDKYRVYFRLCTKNIIENLYRTNLVPIGGESLFDHVKFPVVENGKIHSSVKEIISENKIHRKLHRTHRKKQ